MAQKAGSDGSPILETIETRWFGQGAVPGEVLAWFEALPGEAEAQPARRDYYLRSIHDDGLNVKLREGGLEVKQRQESFGLIRFNRSVVGLVERWFKWRFPLDESSSPILSMIAGDSSWIVVNKERQLKLYRFGGTGADEIAASSSGAATGRFPNTFHLELANVWPGSSQWWTVGYEAASVGQHPQEGLIAVVSAQFEEFAPSELGGSKSFGYPYWLANCFQ